MDERQSVMPNVSDVIRGTLTYTSSKNIYNFANLLTVIRFLLAPCLYWCLIKSELKHSVYLTLAIIVFLVAISTDQLDGFIARKYHMITEFGKLADPIADKILITGTIILLSWHNKIPWWITILIVGRELLVSIARLSIAKKQIITANWGGKLKTLLQSIAIFLTLFPVTSNSFVVFIIWLAALVVTVFSGLFYIFSIYRINQQIK